MMGEAEHFEEWAIVEVMGHRKLGGKVSEATLASGAFIRVDVPGETGPGATQFFNPSAIYCITPVSEDLARRFAQGCKPQPVTRWELPEQAEIVVQEGDAQACRVCGCTDDLACEGGCSWIEPNLCSNCAA